MKGNQGVWAVVFSALLGCAVAMGGTVECPVAIWNDMSSLYKTGKPLELLKKMALKKGSSVLLQGDGVKASVKHEDGMDLFIEADFPGISEKQGVVLAIPDAMQPIIKSKTDGVGVWINAAPYVYLSYLFSDAEGREFVVPAHRQTDEEWQYAATVLRTFLVYEDQKNHGAAAFPVRLTGLRLHLDDRGFERSFAVKLRGMERIEQPEEMPSQRIGVELADAPFGYVFNPGDTVCAGFSAPNETGLIKWQLLDYDGRVLTRGEERGSADARVVLSQPGYYQFLIELIENGRRTDLRSLSLAAITPAAQINETLGVCGHWARWQVPVDSLKLLPILGIRNFRDHSAWHYVEKSPGQLRVPSDMAQSLATARRLGLEGLSIFNGKAVHYGGGAPRTPDAIEAFTDYCLFMAKAYKGVHNKIEFWNEWSNGTGMDDQDFKPTPENYVKFVESIVPNLRDKLEGIELVGLGGENPYRFMGEITDMLASGAGKHFDSLSIHPYRQPFPPEIVHNRNSEPLDETLKKIVALAKKYNAPTKIQLTEIGYPTFMLGWGVDEVEQTRYLVRTLAMLQGCPEVDQVYWYELRDEFYLPIPVRMQAPMSYSQLFFGIFRDERYGYAPKPSAVAMAVYARQTAGAVLGPVIRENGIHRVDVREPGGAVRSSILWTAGDAKTIAVSGGRLEAVDLMGRQKDVGGGQLTVSQDAVYLKGANIRLQEL